MVDQRFVGRVSCRVVNRVVNVDLSLTGGWGRARVGARTAHALALLLPAGLHMLHMREAHLLAYRELLL